MTAAAKCDPTQGDKGFAVSLAVSDANHNGIYEKGETVELSAAGTTNPGGCAGGESEFQFLKDGAVAQNFSAQAIFKDSPIADASYQVMARCSSNLACTTTTGASTALKIYTGDALDIGLTVTHEIVGDHRAVLETEARVAPRTLPLQPLVDAEHEGDRLVPVGVDAELPVGLVGLLERLVDLVEELVDTDDVLLRLVVQLVQVRLLDLVDDRPRSDLVDPLGDALEGSIHDILREPRAALHALFLRSRGVERELG